MYLIFPEPGGAPQDAGQHRTGHCGGLGALQLLQVLHEVGVRNDCAEFAEGLQLCGSLVRNRAGFIPSNLDIFSAFMTISAVLCFSTRLPFLDIT